MSRAFTKEDTVDDPLFVAQRAPLPPGVVNYVTVRGLAALRAELEALRERRAALARSLADVARSPELLAFDNRIAELEARLGSAVLTAPTSLDQVRFATKVTVRDSEGRERSYWIVGVDEANAREHRVAFVSPVAQALLGKRVGDVATVRAPHGEDELEVVAIAHDDDGAEQS